MARDMQDEGYGSLLRKVTGVDLFAAEAHFHESGYRQFYSKHQTWKGYHKSQDHEAVELQSKIGDYVVKSSWVL